jgi:P27 family predicted phage terminase small subunit
MGLRGPAPKPTALKILAGNPGHRPINAAEPKPDPSMPSCPKWLTKEAKAEWRRVARRLHDAGVLTSVDRAVLATYCQAWARWCEAEQMIEQHGQTATNDKGVSYLSPWLMASSMASKDVMQAAAKLGMTPSDRARLTATGTPDATKGGKPKETLAQRLFREAQAKAKQDDGA